MDNKTQQQRAETFHSLHKQGDPLILFNAWDVATARAIGKVSPAVATSSGAVASALGYSDGENVPLDTVIGLVSRITAVVSVPVSIDFEAGYGDTPAEAANSVAAIIKAGAIGINFEDGLSEKKRQLGNADQHAAKISAVRKVANDLGIPLFINARTDPFLLKFGTPEESFNEAAKRARIYADAGASGIFVPGLEDIELIKRFVSKTSLPVNVMVMRGAGPDIASLTQAGVRRISLGPWPMIAAMRIVGEAAASIKTSRAYGSFLNPES